MSGILFALAACGDGAEYAWIMLSRVAFVIWFSVVARRQPRGKTGGRSFWLLAAAIVNFFLPGSREPQPFFLHQHKLQSNQQARRPKFHL